MTGRDWLIAVIVLTVVAAVGVPLLGSVIRSRDYQAQVSGKKGRASRRSQQEGRFGKAATGSTEYETGAAIAAAPVFSSGSWGKSRKRHAKNRNLTSSSPTKLLRQWGIKLTRQFPDFRNASPNKMASMKIPNRS